MGKNFSTSIIAIILSFVSLFVIQNEGSTKSSSEYTICEIQGSGFGSPIAGEVVVTEGVVFADADETWRRGFFMQDEQCDGDLSTSDGLFVYIGTKEDVVSPGDLVTVTGTAQEYGNLTEIRTTPISVTVQSHANPIPAAVDLNPPFENVNAEIYFESLEGMHIQITDAIVVGPTDYDNRTWVIRSDLEMDHVFYDDPRGTGEVIWVDDLSPFQIYPDVKVGDRILNMSGAMDYYFDEYSIFLLAEPQVVGSSFNSNSGLDYSTSGLENHFSIATFNLWNLFDTFDDQDTEGELLSDTEYQDRLHKLALAITSELNEPSIIAVQEVENYDVLMDLVNQPEFIYEYAAVLVEGPDRRGLDTGLLYQPGQVEVISFDQKQGCTDLIDGLGPDGNDDLENPENDITCDTNGDEINDGNRLFSRPPLVVHAGVCLENCYEGAAKNQILENERAEIWIIVNHWKSKYEDTESIQYSLPRRLKQSEFVNNLVQEIIELDQDANIFVLGDLNDNIDSAPLQILENGGLFNLTRDVERDERYTYIYQGISQTLDHILVRTDPKLQPVVITPKHFNSDFPYSFSELTNSSIRSSDHDPVYALFGYFKYPLHFPYVVSGD